jgi:arylsulfatase A-like enzyme
MEGNTIGVWMQTAGYMTGFFGKMVNGYGDVGNARHVIPGWNEWAAFTEAYGIEYFNYRLNENGTLVPYGSKDSDYSTDVLARKAVNFIHKNAQLSKPFFLVIAPKGPHAALNTGSPIPAPRHVGVFANLPIPRSPNFNERDVTDKPKFIQARRYLTTSKQLGRIVQTFRSRRETLLSVDDLLKDVVSTLMNEKVLYKTIIIYTSDNGWSDRSHRLQGKKVVYEESIRVPLIIRWPNGHAGEIRNNLVSNIDIIATIVDQGEAVPGLPLDGLSLAPLIANRNAPWRSSILVEGNYHDVKWSAVRAEFSVYAMLNSPTYGQEEELYTMITDPYQLQNKALLPEFGGLRNRLRIELQSFLSN